MGCAVACWLCAAVLIPVGYERSRWHTRHAKKLSMELPARVVELMNCCVRLLTAVTVCNLTVLAAAMEAKAPAENDVQKACVLGSGAFGTALAQLMARQGVPTMAWTRSQDVTDLINT